MGGFATPVFPGTLPISQSYNQQSVTGSIGPQVPQNQLFNMSFNAGPPLPTGQPSIGNLWISLCPNLYLMFFNCIAKPPVVASHTSLPQQPQRPTATATAAPARKNILSTPGPQPIAGTAPAPQPTVATPAAALTAPTSLKSSQFG